MLPDHKKTVIKLDCEHRFRFCTAIEVSSPTCTKYVFAPTHMHTLIIPTQLAQSFLDSQTCKDMYPEGCERKPPCLENVMSCICDCIKECKRKEVLS